MQGCSFSSAISGQKDNLKLFSCNSSLAKLSKCFFASAASSSGSFQCDNFPLWVAFPLPFPYLRQLQTPGLTNALAVYYSTSCNCFACWLWVLIFLCYHLSIRIDRRVRDYAGGKQHTLHHSCYIHFWSKVLINTIFIFIPCITCRWCILM